MTVNLEVGELIDKGEFGDELEHFQAVGIDRGLRFSPYIDIEYYIEYYKCAKVGINTELISE